ncbi:hypothetical protein GCM10009623_21630 [Nocardioides aestuarii]|uniref:Alpha/beta hydrolase n=1 Tax=Nocardioides aestuarii TaxID=252231 RepID=A0ABW4TKW7_9ACTN
MNDRGRQADLADRYAQMLRLADLFDATGDQLRERSLLGDEVLRDSDVTDSAELAPLTWRTAEDEVRAATTGKQGLLTRGVELDADALMVRATVLTYRWIDDLAHAAERTMGSIAGRAIGYLAPEVELGGAIVSVGLIETDALDRDGVVGYLDELAHDNPTLLNHATSGGGGLLEGLQLRALLTASVLTGDLGRSATLGGLRAVGAEPLAPDVGSALRDAAAGLVDHDPGRTGDSAAAAAPTPRGLAGLLTTLSTTTGSVTVQQVAPHRWITYLPGSGRTADGTARLRLVGGDHSAYAERVVAALREAVHGDPDARVMLVGSAEGGVTAAEIAAAVDEPGFVVDQVVTAGAPSSHLPRIPDHTRVLSLEDRSDPVALLGSLVNATAANRVTVVFDGDGASGAGAYVAGGLAADAADHPELVGELARLRDEGWLA